MGWQYCRLGCRRRVVIIKFCLFCVSEDIDDYEVEDFLADIMNTEFDTIVEDGSLSQVGMSDI